MNTESRSKGRRGWRRLFPLLKRIAAARWLNDAGRRLGEWVAPEWPEIDQVLRDAEATDLTNPGTEAKMIAVARELAVQQET